MLGAPAAVIVVGVAIVVLDNYHVCFNSEVEASVTHLPGPWDPPGSTQALDLDGWSQGQPLSRSAMCSLKSSGMRARPLQVTGSGQMPEICRKGLFPLTRESQNFWSKHNILENSWEVLNPIPKFYR